MDITTTDHGEELVVTIEHDRIDAAIAVHFKDRMREITDHPATRVILDLGKVDFLDSSGLGAVVASMKQLGPGRKLELVALTPTVDRVFRLTRMDSVFAIHADTQAALGTAFHAS